jgi:hypothetical protein
MAIPSPPYFSTERDGNWSRPQQYHDSPWWASDEEAVVGLVPGDGYCITIRHVLTMDVDTIIGPSFQTQIWDPLAVSLTAGSAVTNLRSSTYAAAAAIFSPKGRTYIGNTLTATFAIVNGVSRPRITFASPPPAGCSYWLFLSDMTDGQFIPRVYCRGITGTTVDLVAAESATYNIYDAGVAVPGALPSEDYYGGVSPGECNALTIQAAGSIVVAAGKTLTYRGDVEIQSPVGSTKPYFVINRNGILRPDASQATAPTEYRVLMRGGGDIRYTG